MKKYKEHRTGKIKTAKQIGFEITLGWYNDSVKQTKKGILEGPYAHPDQLPKKELIEVGEEVAKDSIWYQEV